MPDASRSGAKDARCFHAVTVQPPGQCFDARQDETLLQAAQRAGLDWPRSCRNGSCRSCRTRVLAGPFRHQIEWPGLSAEEKKEGWVLPCVAVALGDLTVLNPSEALA
jgi:ferredoxin